MSQTTTDLKQTKENNTKSHLVLRLHERGSATKSEAETGINGGDAVAFGGSFLSLLCATTMLLNAPGSNSPEAIGAVLLAVGGPALSADYVEKNYPNNPQQRTTDELLAGAAAGAIVAVANQQKSFSERVQSSKSQNLGI